MKQQTTITFRKILEKLDPPKVIKKIRYGMDFGDSEIKVVLWLN